MLKVLLSGKLIRILSEINGRYFDGYATKSYSQEGEDMILKALVGGQKKGFYVDVGAHHPKRFSNTYFFYKQGWRGINIDAMPGSMKLFNIVRSEDINIEKPVSDKKQTLTYYSFNEPAINGFSKELSLERNKKKEYCIESTKDIETFTLDEILDNNLPQNKQIDFLSIDVEGLDFMVLKSNNFDKYRPKIILIEILGSTIEEIANGEISKFLKTYNYFFYARSVRTAFFVYDENV